MGNPLYAPQQLRKDLRGEFIEALLMPRGPSIADQIATTMQSTSSKENYAWLSEVSPMSEFKDQLSHTSLTETGTTTGAGAPGYEVTNLQYAAALCINRNDLSDEKTGGLSVRIKDLATRAYYLKDKLLVDKINSGTTDTCYLEASGTAEAFFTATHAARGEQTATWSNLHTGTGTTTSYVKTDISTAIAGLYNMLDEANEPMNQYLTKLFILYPPALHGAISEAVRAGFISSTSNVEFDVNNIALIQCPWLTSTSAADYYVGFNDPGIIRPMMWQEREGVTMEEIGQGSDTWTNLRQVIYAAFARGAAAYGKPQRMIKVNN